MDAHVEFIFFAKLLSVSDVALATNTNGCPLVMKATLIEDWTKKSKACLKNSDKFSLFHRSICCCLYICCPSQDGEECPLLPLCLVLCCHRFHRVHHHCFRPWGMENPVLRPRSLDADIDCCPGYRWPGLPHKGPTDREGWTCGPDEDCGCGTGFHLSVYFL